MNDPSFSENQSAPVIWPELWSAFAAHRKKVTNVLRTVAPNPNGSLSVWGAGRTTDLDLSSLLQHYATIELVDLDPELTRGALVQRELKTNSNVTVAPRVDITGVNEQLEAFKDSPTESKLEAIIDSSQHTKLDLGQYDVVVSTCLLSQVLRQVFSCLAESGLPNSVTNQYLPRILRAIREKHIELILDHTLPGGSGVLITDLTSSHALPEMLMEGADLQQLLMTKVVKGNHFHGLNPRLILEASQTERIASKLDDVQITSPWVWNSIEMQYLCVAFQFRKSS